MNALHLQLRGSPGVSTAGGGSLSIRTLQLGFVAELTSCYGGIPSDITTTTSTTSTTSTTPAPGTTTTTTAAPGISGYCWKRLKLVPPELEDPGIQPEGCQAFPLDGNQALGPGVLGWLEPSPDAVGWIIVAYEGIAGPCPTTTTTSTTAPPCTGGCNWTYSTSTKLWTLDSNTCGSNAVITEFCPTGGVAREFTSTLAGFLGTDCESLDGSWTWTYSSGYVWYGSLNGIASTFEVDPSDSSVVLTFATDGGDVTYTGTIACSGEWTLTADDTTACTGAPSEITMTPVVPTVTNCGCYYPDFCPTCSGTQTTTTDCFANVTSYGNHPQCNTTTTAAPGPGGCNGGNCEWKSYPVSGWVKIYDPCGTICPCATPGGGLGPQDCSPGGPTLTPCASPPPPPPCTGNCLWVWGDASTGWILKTNSCTGGGFLGCNCSPPTIAGTVCGTEQFTPCVGNSTTNTSTTAPPLTCVGRCYWCWSGSAWTFDRTDCIGCLCSMPQYDGTDVGEVGMTACESIITTTTTTTSTTSTTSTTTTTTHGGPCCYVLTACTLWPSNDPAVVCACSEIGTQACFYPNSPNSCPASFVSWCQVGVETMTWTRTAVYSNWAACEAGCATGPAPTTTTTTTTTTAAPGAFNWCCNFPPLATCGTLACTGSTLGTGYADFTCGGNCPGGVCPPC